MTGVNEMNESFVKTLCCPYCSGAVKLHPVGIIWDGNRVKEGSIICVDCSKQGFEIIETIIVERFRLNNAKNDVQEFWNHHPCMGEWENESKQMDGVRKYRYDTHPWLHKEVAEFSRHTADLVLEIGCSQGCDMVEFLLAGVKGYIGIDLTINSLMIAKRRLEYYGLYNHNVNLICADAENIPLIDCAVDYIYSYGVIHHSENTQSIIHSMGRVLKKSGSFTVMYYYKYSLTALIEGSAKMLNRALVFMTRDRDVFWKLCKYIPYRPEIGHYRKFLDTGYSAILHAPFAHVYSRRESKKMFIGFSIKEMKLYQLSPVIKPLVQKIFGKGFIDILACWCGWDLVIKGSKI